MKFLELKKHLLTNDYYRCYNIYGDDSFLLDSSKNMIINYASNKNEFDRVVANAENFNLDSLLSNLNSASFFGGTKLVILGGVEAQKSKEIVNLIFQYSKSPNPNSIFLIISDSQIIDDKKIIELNKNGKYFAPVDCSRLDRPMLLNWINDALSKKNACMAEDAKLKLIDFTNGYLSRISIELNKLISYKQDEITSNDVELLVNKELEYSVFELTENLGRGNAEKTFAILNDMMADKKAAPSVLGILQNYFRRLFFCAITPKTNAQIAAELGIKEYAVKKAKEASALFSKITLKKIVDLCADLDYKFKSGQIPYQNAVDCLIMYVLLNNKNNKD